jgi:hypothetical protein
MLKKKPLLSAACVCECILFYFLFYFVLFVHTLTFTFILITAKHTHCDRQCDQIGRIFAQWVIAYFGQFIENDRNSPHYWATYFQRLGVCLKFGKKLGWAVFWATFSQTHLVTLAIGDPFEKSLESRFGKIAELMKDCIAE